MSIVDLQRGIQEAGRIRIGQQVPTGNGRTRPEKLETFRLTSSDKRRIEQAAVLYGGTVSEWEAPAGRQWQVITATDSLDVIVPPADLAFSQHYELWSAGGCQRRCDGVTESIGEQPCICDPAARECDIHTRLSVMLRDLPGLGVWRIDTSGWYAAKELGGAVQIIQIAAGRGALLPARLRLEQRSTKRQVNGKPQTLRYAVPVLDVEVTSGQLLTGEGANGHTLPMAVQEPTTAPLTPVPALPGPTPSIAEQSAPPPARAARKGSAPTIPASSRSRRTRGIDSPAQADPDPEPVDTPAVSVEAEVPPAPAAPSEPKHAPGDPGYWPAKVHAAAAERGLDHDDLHEIAGAVLGWDVADMPRFSLSPDAPDDVRLGEADWEQVDAWLRKLPVPMTIDRARKWMMTKAAQRPSAVFDVDPDASTGALLALAVRVGRGDLDPVPVVTA